MPDPDHEYVMSDTTHAGSGVDAHAASHQEIGLAALRRGHIDAEQLVVAMCAVGRAPTASLFEVWIQSGLLDRTELAELLQQLRRRNGESSGPGEATQLALVGAAEQHTGAVGEDVNASLTLADVLRTFGPDRPLQLREAPRRGALGRASESAPVSSSEAELALHAEKAQEKARYLLGGELGRGGGGRVVKAFDRHLGRSVALKALLEWPQSREVVEAFVEEAQATGQLEHPNIVPIYDIGRLPDGQVFYTMKRVRNRSLRDALEGLRAGDPDVVEEYGQTRLLTIFLQVVQAIHYAHVRGVIHRDLKPDNIMLGDYGEVHVMDWGLARILQKGVVTERSLRMRSDSGAENQTVGTPAYMPPEQARGDLASVDERSDVYSLGVILYEMMTLRQPSTRSTVMETLMAVIADPITPPRRAAPDRNISEDMEQIIMRALEKEPAKRWASAKHLHDAVEKYLDGRNEREARRHLYEGERQSSLYDRARGEVLELEQEVRELAARIEEWRPVEDKRALWRVEDRLRDARTRMVRKFGDAVRDLTQSLAYVPDFVPARRALSRLLWSRFRLAERDNNELEQLTYENLLRQYDDGTYLARIDGEATCSFHLGLRRAELFLSRHVERDRCMELGNATHIGSAPVATTRVSRGGYLLRVKAPGAPLVRVPLFLRRSEPEVHEITVARRENVLPGYLFIHGGQTIIGGDREAFDALPRSRQPVDHFCIQQYPVTFREYIAFLDALAEGDPERVEAHLPRIREGEGLLVTRDAAGGFRPAPILIEGPMRELYPEGSGAEWHLPVLGINHEDALAYCRWRSEETGFPITLPTELEWERASRGADGRVYPWGNHFDPTFCKMNASRRMPSQPEPVGSFPVDRSPFGVHDMAGGVREIVANPNPDGAEVVVRGGSWAADARFCRVGTRSHILRDARLSNVGLRTAYRLERWD